MLLPGPRQAKVPGDAAAESGVSFAVDQGCSVAGGNPSLAGGSPLQGFLVSPAWRLSRRADAGALRSQLVVPPPSSGVLGSPLAALTSWLSTCISE